MHSGTDQGRLTLHLQAILGMDGYIALTGQLGGTRLYVPYAFADDHGVVLAVGRERADKLSRAMAPATIRVPLARRERALYWRAQGLSDALVARKLGMTENGVGKLFAREEALPDRPGSASNDPQLSLL